MHIQNDKVYALLKGRSQSDIARVMGVKLSNINVWLNGVRVPRYDRLKHLADTLDVPVDELAMKLRDICNERRK
ncbi:HTH_XRE domain containing protein [uncultured Caudovirales phage]|uniref:HTH_XRE domain containing protein n=1 Tax=uncultured Caudovirales phage TaxID=2100421 RepID=A0A6J7WIP6_9CAUD|nr:HTH_XRE domain containing protein [uncultured Caudovirales phage]